ncbi:MAG: phosphatidate cytidylyltransferase [Saprospiraceae bacterium]
MNNYQVSPALAWVLGGIFAFLTLSSLTFYLLSKKRSGKLLDELRLRTRSWWYIFMGIAIIALGPSVVGTTIIAYVSFVALREMFSISGFREADRVALVASYFAIPVQYYLAFHHYMDPFYYFIPLVMSIVIPFILVLTGNTERIGRSMSFIITVLILTIYMLSHIALLFNLEIPGYTVGAGGLLLYLIVLTGFNDVFQFIWGKWLGKRKILPKVSPNKTWEGFLGGIMTTAGLGYCIRFLSPFSAGEALITGLLIGITGFIGDAILSAIKRDLQLKDTDDLIPGHGGAMDRLDSIVFTAPVFYHLLNYFIQH